VEPGTAVLTWRALTPDDAPALTRWYAALEAVDATGEHFSEHDARDQLQDDGVDLPQDTIAAVDAGGEFAAVGWLYGTIALGGVVPAVRGRGLGRRLLEWAEERVAARQGDAIRVDVHQNNPSKEALVRAAGYEAVRWEHRMSRALDDALPGVPATPAGLTLTPYLAGRDHAVWRAHVEAFADHWGAGPPDEQRWAHWFTGSRAFQPEVSWLVLDGDEVAGYLLTYFWEADAAGSGVREAFLGQLGVRPPWRQHGLGGLLIARALASYRDAGFERATLTVDTGNATGALGLYERAGFAVRDTSVSWTKASGAPCADPRRSARTAPRCS
jgi:mycothiol synthase